MSIAESCWQRPAIWPGLAANEVHLWRFRLDISSPAADSISRLLSCDERRRAERLIQRHHQCRFICGRAGMRLILARYLDNAPEQLAFDYGEWGKPHLRRGPLHFNLSHAGSLAVLAVSITTQLGVDIEQLPAIEAFDQIARRFFSEQERELLRSAPPHRQRRTFCRLWVSKEALAKSSGEGLPAQPKLPNAHSLYRFVPGRHTVGALACRQPINQLGRFELDSEYLVQLWDRC